MSEANPPPIVLKDHLKPTCLSLVRARAVYQASVDSTIAIHHKRSRITDHTGKVYKRTLRAVALIWSASSSQRTTRTLRFLCRVPPIYNIVFFENGLRLEAVHVTSGYCSDFLTGSSDSGSRRSE